MIHVGAMHVLNRLESAVYQCTCVKLTKEELGSLNTFVAAIQQQRPPNGKTNGEHCVRGIPSSLNDTSSDSEGDEEDLELSALDTSLNRRHFLREVVQPNPAPHCYLDQLAEFGAQVWTHKRKLDWFLFYVFHRRYGWPDLEEEGTNKLRVCSLQSVDSWRLALRHDELHFKPKLVNALDMLILWLNHQPVTIMIIEMFSSAIRIASTSPVTRLQLAIHAFDLLKERLSDFSNIIFTAVQELVILVVTDVWSQIRSAGVIRIGPVIEKFSIGHTQDIFNKLVQLCDAGVNTWQVTDGAISAINAIVKRFQHINYNLNGSGSVDEESRSNELSPRMHCQIRFGEEVMDRLPAFITRSVNSLVFQLVSNPQLTIRETAIKAFVNCLTMCGHLESELAFDDVYRRLHFNATGISRANGNEESLTMIDESSLDFSKIDPYTSESLLHLISFLFKRIPSYQSQCQNWDLKHHVFALYLMHPASSVRLATSNLYKCVVARSISSPLLVKNFIWCLIRGWNPNQRTLLSTISTFSQTAPSKRCCMPQNRGSRLGVHAKDLSSQWEWREGRLLVYELICQLLIKNHHVYTFGPATRLSLDMPSSPTMQPTSTTFETSRSTGTLASIRTTTLLSTSDTALNTIGTDSGLGGETPDSSSSSIHKQIHTRSPSACVIFPSKLPDLTLPSPTASSTPQKLTKHKYSSFFNQVKEIEVVQLEMSKRQEPNTGTDQLPTFRTLVSRMLHTCIESLADPQWEVRRIAKQTFPCLGELIRWSEPSLLVELLTTHLVFNPTVMTFAGLTLLRDSLKHAAKLNAFQASKPEVLKNTDSFLVLFQTLEVNLEQWLRSCHFYLSRQDHLDCISPLTAHVVILAIGHFCYKKKCNQMSAHISSLLSVFKVLNEALSREAITEDIHKTSQSSIAICPFDLFASSSPDRSPARDMCLHLLLELRDDLSHLLSSCCLPLGDVAALMTFMITWIPHLVRTRTPNALEAVKVILNCISGLSSRLQDSSAVSTDLQCSLNLIISEAAHILSDKQQLEHWWIRQLVDLVLPLVSIKNVDFSSFIRCLLSCLPPTPQPGSKVGVAKGPVARRISCVILPNRPAAPLPFKSSLLPSPSASRQPPVPQRRRSVCSAGVGGGVGDLERDQALSPTPGVTSLGPGFRGDKCSVDEEGERLQLCSSEAHAELCMMGSDSSLNDSDKDESSDLFPLGCFRPGSRNRLGSGSSTTQAPTGPPGSPPLSPLDPGMSDGGSGWDSSDSEMEGEREPQMRQEERLVVEWLKVIVAKRGRQELIDPTQTSLSPSEINNLLSTTL